MRGSANQARHCIKPKEKYDGTACVISLNEPSFCIWDTFMDLLLANLLREGLLPALFLHFIKPRRICSIRIPGFAPYYGKWILASGAKICHNQKDVPKIRRRDVKLAGWAYEWKRCTRSDASIKQVPASLHIIKCFIKSTQRRGGDDECIFLFSMLSNVTLLLINL